MEESLYFEPGEGTHGPVELETATARNKIYPSFVAVMDSLPKRQPEPPPPPKPRPTPKDHHAMMSLVRLRHREAAKTNEEHSRKKDDLKKEIYFLMGQKDQVEVERVVLLDKGDQKGLSEVNSQIEVLEHQISKRNAEAEALQGGEDETALLREVMEKERFFYAMQLDSYQRQVAAGTCALPFDLLLKRCFALSTQCGVYDIKRYLFENIPANNLSSQDVEEIIKGIEAEYEK